MASQVQSQQQQQMMHGGQHKKQGAKFANVPMRTLGDGHKIPAMGLGTLNLNENDAFECIKNSIECGFRCIDTSPVYGNEQAIGNALKQIFQSGLCKREDLYIVSKLWITDRNNVKDALKQSIASLQCGYVDLYLIHYMVPDVVKDSLMVERVSTQEVWKQMEHCREEKLCKSIGVMNCPIVMFLEILTFCHIRPALNCLEMHPYFTQDESLKFYRQLKTPVAAYAPLVPNQNLQATSLPENIKNLDLLNEGLIKDLAKKYQKSPAQIIMNWHMHHEQVVFPGMRLREHFEENCDVFNFEMSQDDLNKITGLNKNARFYDRIQDANYNYIPIWQ